jgi:bacterial/archaeal transporter family-2 protein
MNNIAEIISVVIIGLIGGIGVGLQGPISGAMSAKIGPLGSSLIIHIGGTILSLVLVLFVGGVNLREVGNLPRVGVTVSVALLILAQLVLGVLIDHFGWMGAAQHSFNATRALGVALLIAGAWLVTK